MSKYQRRVTGRPIGTTIATKGGLKMIDGAVAVPRPAKEQVLLELGMRCSAREIPDPLAHWIEHDQRDAKPDGWWLAAGCAFEGCAWPLNKYGELSPAEPITATRCTAAFCVANGRLLAIVSPNSPSEPAIWVSASCSEVRIEAAQGQELRNRSELRLLGGSWIINIIQVSRLFRHITQHGLGAAPQLEERFQTGQKASFVKALTGAARQPGAKPTLDAPSICEDYQWVREDGLVDLYRLVRQGRRTTATSLVDRELEPEEQAQALEAIDWAPAGSLAPLIEAARNNTMRKLFIPELPEGRVGNPFPIAYLSIFLDTRPATHPVSRYLWPSLSEGGDLVLDPDEQIVHSWEPGEIRLARHKPDNSLGLGVTIDRNRLVDPQVYLTTNRLVAIARREPAQVTAGDRRLWWGAHFRYEWIYEIGSVQTTHFKRTLVRAKPIPTGVSEGFYARLRLSSGTIDEINLFVSPGESSVLRELIDRAGVLITSSDHTRRTQPVPVSSDERLFGTSVRTAIAIEGAVPYSLPSQLKTKPKPSIGSECPLLTAEDPDVAAVTSVASMTMSDAPATPAEMRDDRAAVAAKASWKCPHCGVRNAPDAAICMRCARPLPDGLPSRE